MTKSTQRVYSTNWQLVVFVYVMLRPLLACYLICDLYLLVTYMITPTKYINARNLRYLVHYLNAVWNKSCGMVKAVSRLPVTAEDRITPQVNPCGICGRQTYLEHVFLRILRVFPDRIISPKLPILSLICHLHYMSLSSGSVQQLSRKVKLYFTGCFRRIL